MSDGMKVCVPGAIGLIATTQPVGMLSNETAPQVVIGDDGESAAKDCAGANRANKAVSDSERMRSASAYFGQTHDQTAPGEMKHGNCAPMVFDVKLITGGPGDRRPRGSSGLWAAQPPPAGPQGEAGIEETEASRPSQDRLLFS